MNEEKANQLLESLEAQRTNDLVIWFQDALDAFAKDDAELLFGKGARGSELIDSAFFEKWRQSNGILLNNWKLRSNADGPELLIARWEENDA